MNKAGIFVSFILGAAAGVLLSRRYFSTKFGRIADEEIQSVKEVFSKRSEGYSEAEKEDVKTSETPEKKPGEPVDYSGITGKSSAANIPAQGSDIKQIYTITPEQYGEFEGYTSLTLNCFADGIIAEDDTGRKLILSSLNVGTDIDFEKLFESDDVIYVRNDETHADYEVVYDERTYEQFLAANPYILEEQ